MAIGAAAIMLAAGHAVRGDRAPLGFLLVLASCAAVLIGVAAEVVRVVSARRRWRDELQADEALAAEIIRWRGRRRLASAAGHLGFALIVLGLAGGEIVDVDTVRLRPGQRLLVPGVMGGSAQLTYLGLSRYQVGALERRVASFRLDRDANGKGAASMMTASLNTDLRSGRQFSSWGLQRGVLADIVVGIASLTDADGILCRCGTRPLASLFWLGAILLLLALATRVSGGP